MTPLKRLLSPKKLEMLIDVETQRILFCVLRVSATGHASPDFYQLDTTYGWSLLNDDDDAEPICTWPTVDILNKLGYDISPLDESQGLVNIETLSMYWPKEIAALHLVVCDAQLALNHLRRNITCLRLQGANVNVGAGPNCGLIGYRSLTRRPGYPGGRTIRKFMFEGKQNA